jgi:uncharacterized protein YutD
MHTHANHLYPKLGVHTLEDALHKLFGNSGCPYACLRRERERERESQAEEMTKYGGRHDNLTGGQAYSLA